MKIIKSSLIPLVDILLTFLMVFVSITMLINVKVQKENSDAYQQENAIYQIVLNWEGESDLDLWCRDPMGRIVSFHRREGGDGSLFSLNRDCLGASTTEKGENGKIISKINEEIITLRGTFTGEYTVNVHAYNKKGSSQTRGTVKLIQSKPYKELKVVEKLLTSSGQEETFFRFTVDGETKVVEFSDLPTSLTSSENEVSDPSTSPLPPMPFR